MVVGHPVLLPAGANLSNLLYYLYYARRYEDAMEQAIHVLEIDPTIYRANGRSAGAIKSRLPATPILCGNPLELPCHQLERKFLSFRSAANHAHCETP